MKQCEHCRGARKAKAHHARCDCGDKKDKDKSKVGGKSEYSPLIHFLVELAANGGGVGQCRCYSGQKCCCGKKDSKTKPRLPGTNSDPTLTVFANRHHKPCHRMNNSAHISGMPYKIPHSSSRHGSPSSMSLPHDDLDRLYGVNQVSTPSQRPIDSFGMDLAYGAYSPAPGSVDSLPMTPMSGPLDADGTQVDLQRLVFNGQQGAPAVASGTNSPVEQRADQLPNQQWTNQWMNSTNNYGFDGNFAISPTVDSIPRLDSDWQPNSMGTDPLWSATDLPLDPNKLSNNVAQPISQSGDSGQVSAPGLTPSSSGAQSDIGEPVGYPDYDYTKVSRPATADQVYWDEGPRLRGSPPFRLSPVPMQQEMRQAPTSVPTAEPEVRRSMDGAPESYLAAGSGVDMYGAVATDAPAFSPNLSQTDLSAKSFLNNPPRSAPMSASPDPMEFSAASWASPVMGLSNSTGSLPSYNNNHYSMNTYPHQQTWTH